MGAYSLTPEGNNYLEFVENYKSETIINFLEKLREMNPTGTILLLIDNFSSHKTKKVKNKAKELNIELCYLPTYSPQLQPIEKIWKANKREIGEYKVTSIYNYKELKKEDRKRILESIISDSFYNLVENKNKWNKVLNNYIIPKIKLYSPEFNEELVVQKC